MSCWNSRQHFSHFLMRLTAWTIHRVIRSDHFFGWSWVVIEYFPGYSYSCHYWMDSSLYLSGWLIHYWSRLKGHLVQTLLVNMLLSLPEGKWIGEYMGNMVKDSENCSTLGGSPAASWTGEIVYTAEKINVNFSQFVGIKMWTFQCALQSGLNMPCQIISLNLCLSIGITLFGSWVMHFSRTCDLAVAEHDVWLNKVAGLSQLLVCQCDSILPIP